MVGWQWQYTRPASLTSTNIYTLVELFGEDASEMADGPIDENLQYPSVY